MKATGNILTGLLLATGLITGLYFLHAQETATTIQTGTASLSAAPLSTAPDSIVRLTAESEGLALAPSAEVPDVGTFWIVTADGLTAPFPFLPPGDQGFPVYAITNDIFLVDASGGQVNPQWLGATTTAQALVTLANEVEKVITQTQTASASQPMQAMTGGVQAMDAGVMSGGFAPAFSFSANSLWLQITGVTNGVANLILNNATNQVYAVWSTTNLSTPFANWQVETDVWPTNGAMMPWTVATANRDTLFLRAEDWTGVTANGNQTPCWWFYLWFGPTGRADLSDSTLDGNNQTLLSDYQAGSNPSTINFTVRLGNQHFNTTAATGSFLVVGGIPNYETVLVNDDNLTDAVWQPYDGNIAMNLGPTDGVYQVWFGLKGFATNSQPEWFGTTVYLDRVAPQIFLTSPTNATTAVPVLQVQGWSPEELKERQL